MSTANHQSLHSFIRFMYTYTLKFLFGFLDATFDECVYRSEIYIKRIFFSPVFLLLMLNLVRYWVIACRLNKNAFFFYQSVKGMLSVDFTATQNQFNVYRERVTTLTEKIQTQKHHISSMLRIYFHHAFSMNCIHDT